MKRFIQHEALFVRHFETEKWPFPLHNHDHYELVFIHSGKGIHSHNQVDQAYSGRSLFLLAPQDAHIFEISERTEFSVLKFNNLYLEGVSNEKTPAVWRKLVDHLLAIAATYDTCLLKSEQDMEKIEQLMRLIVQEWEANAGLGNEVMFHLIRAVFSILKRNVIGNIMTTPSSNGDLVISIIEFIHAHIHQPESLKLNVLALHFNFSPNYLSSLFKRQVKVSIKQYIDDYKYKLIETQLNSGGKIKKEISNEFGFNDLSHFLKFLKRYANAREEVLSRNDNGQMIS
ncbi:AraC family transcriptional regulator [Pedobacter sp. PLR]|uniref:AraC family transcriptional regulator n=1 Tax=Pedobacter sp. PLR TaxID=2994465 RepID=UPI00224532CE|nr:AraC family transcriptional regulator [Pedobacter sp. PLR]MCX2451206.1 AraC family transcriptional regulator [Pedobacter sp. PLR]